MTQLQAIMSVNVIQIHRIVCVLPCNKILLEQTRTDNYHCNYDFAKTYAWPARIASPDSTSMGYRPE